MPLTHSFAPPILSASSHTFKSSPPPAQTSNSFIHSADCSLRSLPPLFRSGKDAPFPSSVLLLFPPLFHPLPFICRLHLPFGDTFPALAICRLFFPSPSIFQRLRLAFIYCRNTAANPYPVTQALALPQRHKSPPSPPPATTHPGDNKHLGLNLTMGA